MLPPHFQWGVDPMSKSRKQKDRAAASNLSRGGKPEKEPTPDTEEGWRWELADRPLSREEFVERANALRRELRSSISTTDIIRAHRDGCYCKLDEGSSE